MKEIWSGFLRAIGAFIATAGIAMLGLWLLPIKRWVASWFVGKPQPGITGLMVFFAALSAVLLGLLVWSRITYSRFRMRVYEKKVAEKELQPEAWKHSFREMEAKIEKFRGPRQSFADRMLQWLLRL